jgi:hypothetical protein
MGLAGLLAQWAPAPATVPYLPHIALMVIVLMLLRSAPETVTRGSRPLRLTPPGLRSARFRTVVAPMAPWVFAAPAVAFALLPSVTGAGHAASGIALSAVVTALTALAGVAIQPVARRLDESGRGNGAATAGLLVLTAALALAAVTAQDRQLWLLVPCAIVFGSAYGLCLVAGLVEVHRIAGPHAQAGLTAAYYTLAYVGFAVPSLLVLAAHLASYAILLAITAALALSTAALVTWQARKQQPNT